MNNNNDENEIIYFVSEEPFSGMIKIGKTNNNVNNRISSMQTGNPRKLTCLMQLERPKKYDYEKLFHKLFADRSIRGEWYSIDRLILEKIRMLTCENDFATELKSLCTEFLGKDSKFYVFEDKIDIDVPQSHTNRCASKLHGNKSVSKITKKAINKKINNLNDFNEIACAKTITKQQYKNIKEQIKSGIKVNENETYYQMKKYRLMKYYGIYYDDQDNKELLQNNIFNDKENVKRYSNKKIMMLYKEISYRDLPIEFIEKIDSTNTVNMNDSDKLNYHYLSGRHAIISKIREILKNGKIEYWTIMSYIKVLYENKIPQFAKYSEPTNQTLMSMVNKLIRPYGFRVESNRVGKGIDRRKLMFIKDYAAELFEITVLPYDSDIATKNMIIQTSNNKKPIALVYTV